jgi:signal transduction histidine kinase
LRRLHLKFYLAIVGTILMFLVAGAMVWHHFSSPLAAVSGIETATGLAASMIDDAPTAERQREILRSLAQQLYSDVALYDAAGAELHIEGRVPALSPAQVARQGWHMRHGGPVFNWALADGRHLIVHPRHKFFWHGLHMGVLLTTIAVVLALLTYPITRGITARLARLEAGVLQFGTGDLSARVRVEGRDEVASLAKSFNDSAARIEQLVRAHQMLLANCSHELRTPLTRIRLAVERVPATDPHINAELARNIAELDALIGEMLLSSRLDVARHVERTEPVDLLALAAEEAAHFDLEVSGDPGAIPGDPMLLRRLVRNLLENARVHAGGARDLRIEMDGQSARIVVEDSGAGVLAEDRERIFEPFYRSKHGAATATPSSGAGLGLSIVRQIARAHGGSVEYSPREGGGSRFTVTLPRNSDA